MTAVRLCANAIASEQLAQQPAGHDGVLVLTEQLLDRLDSLHRHATRMACTLSGTSRRIAGSAARTAPFPQEFLPGPAINWWSEIARHHPSTSARAAAAGGSANHFRAAVSVALETASER